MTSDGIVPWLFGITLVVGLVYALLQWRSARHVQQQHEHSAMPPPATGRADDAAQPRP